MKKLFFDIMLKLMEENPDIYLIFIDLGYPRVDEFKKFGDRCISLGASEQTALDIAVGLAYSGKIPVTYTITPFYFRAFETIRTYIDHEHLNVKMIGAGRDEDYSQHDGFSHYAGDDQLAFDNKYRGFFTNIHGEWPEASELEETLREMIKDKNPWYCNISR